MAWGKMTVGCGPWGDTWSQGGSEVACLLRVVSEKSPGSLSLIAEASFCIGLEDGEESVSGMVAFSFPLLAVFGSLDGPPEALVGLLLVLHFFGGGFIMEGATGSSLMSIAVGESVGGRARVDRAWVM
jgi:hypothetical protein